MIRHTEFILSIVVGFGKGHRVPDFHYRSQFKVDGPHDIRGVRG